jgi:hypothetical protein
MKRAWKWIADRLVLWNRITFRRPWTMQMSIRPSFLGLIVERRRQKRRMKDF